MTRTSTAAAALILPLLVASCATLSEWSESMEQPATAEASAAEMNRAAEINLPMGGDPDVAGLMARMNQLEQDMAEVRIEMSRILPAIERLNAAAQRSTTNRVVNLRPASTIGRSREPAIAEENRFAVHLASYRNREGAIAGWSELRGRFGPVLNSLEPRVAAVEIEGRGTFYRLKAGPFINWGSANEVCDYLRAESWSCAVMDFSGEAAE